MVPPKFLRRFFPGGSRKSSLIEMAEGLMSERGEASSVARAHELLASYLQAPASERLEFLLAMPGRFGADSRRIDKAIAQYQASPRPENARKLHQAAEPRLQELLRRLNLAPGGTAMLVQMREDVLAHAGQHAELKSIDADFAHLFASWFNRGFLELRRIDWATPALILERIIRYEAVHEINSWSELRGRLEPLDRRCFAFFHPAMPNDPLIFVEVALTAGIPDRIAPLLAESHVTLDPQKADTAVFYSISNCQVGLQGISFGNFLIKQVVEELGRELSRLKNFVTLSPVPGFAAWLNRDGKSALAVADQAALRGLEQDGWQDSPELCRAMQPALTRAVAHYLVNAKTGSGKPRDPVARFHLNNGARLERINWLADVSAKGMRNAQGFMVNYLYDLDDIEKHHEAFANNEPVAASRQVRALARSRRASEGSAETGAGVRLPASTSVKSP